MRYFNIFISLESPTFSNFQRMWVTLTLLLLFFAGGISAQGPCDQISFSKEDFGPCEFGMSYSTQTDCYKELRFILTSGEFASYTINSADGFLVQEISPSELWVTHEFGFIPTNFHIPLFFTLPYDLNTSMSVAFDNACAQLGCEIIGGWPIESCPDPKDASIIGVKYRECGSLPYTNQATIPGWPIQLLDADGNIIEEQVTGADGSYAFYDRPSGLYIVSEAQQTGWTPRIPLDGRYTVDLAPSQQVVRNFGNCPECSCDSIEIYSNQEWLQSDTILDQSDTIRYQLQIFNAKPNCFKSVLINIDSIGDFAGWDILLPGWTVDSMGPKLIRLSSPTSFLPAGATYPLNYKVKGAGEQLITVSTTWDNGIEDEMCSKTYLGHTRDFNLGLWLACCLGGPGAYNLIPNSNFSLGDVGFSTQLTKDCISPMNDGTYCISSTPGSLDPTFSPCSGNNMLVVNGPTSWLSNEVWSTTVPVVPHQNYIFGINHARISQYSPPKFSFSINNFYTTSGPLTPGICSWSGTCILWNSGSNTSATLRIKDLNIVSIGNDFALDNLSFFPCPHPPSCQAIFSASPLDNCGKYQFTNTSTNTPANVQYCWDFDNNPATCESTATSPAWQFPACGTYNVRLTISSNGCSSSTTQTITVLDNIPPTALCLPGMGIDLGANCSAQITPAMIDGGSTDNCQIQSMSVSPTVITGCGITTVTLTVTDWCGNTSTCATGIQATEIVPPIALCVPGMGVDLGPNCSVPITPAMIDGGSTDNCQIAGMTVSPTAITECGITTVTLTVTDWCGNTSTCTTGIQATEIVPPVIPNCPPSISVGMDPGQCYYTVPAYHIVATDNCDSNPSVTCTWEEASGSILPFNPPFQMPKYNNTIRCKATDDCGNESALCVFVISVIDNQQPTLTCPQDVTVQSTFTPTGQCEAVVNNLAPIFSDNCPIMSLDYGISPSGAVGTNDASGVLFKDVSTVTYTLVDCGGGTKTCSFTVTVTCISETIEVGRVPFALRIIPNPNPGVFIVELPKPADRVMEFRINDPTGRMVLARPVQSGMAMQTIQAGELPAGLYFLQVVSDGKILALEKFVKQ